MEKIYEHMVVMYFTIYFLSCVFLAHLRVMWAIATTGRLSLAFCILINSSKTTGPIWTKLWWNGPWVVPLQNYVRQSPLPTKIDSVTKNRKFGKKSLKNYLLWNYWANWAQTMVEWSLGGHLSELCPTTPAANQDGHHY